MMAKRESYENEVLGSGVKMEKEDGWRGSRQWRWQLVLRDGSASVVLRVIESEGLFEGLFESDRSI